MSDVDPTKAPAAETDALSHAWAWFAMHSGQRMQSINYFLISIAFIVAGYGAAYAGTNYVVALAISVVGVGVTYTFRMLDRRTRQLVKASEVPIAYIQRELSDRSGVPGMELLSDVERPLPGHLTYTQSLAILTTIIYILMAVAFLVSLGALISFPPVVSETPAPTFTP